MLKRRDRPSNAGVEALDEVKNRAHPAMSRVLDDLR